MDFRGDPFSGPSRTINKRGVIGKTIIIPGGRPESTFVTNPTITLHCILYAVYCAHHSVYYIVYCALCTTCQLCGVHCIQYTVHCVLHCILCTVCCILYTQRSMGQSAHRAGLRPDASRKECQRRARWFVSNRAVACGSLRQRHAMADVGLSYTPSRSLASMPGLATCTAPNWLLIDCWSQPLSGIQAGFSIETCDGTSLGPILP